MKRFLLLLAAGVIALTVVEASAAEPTPEPLRIKLAVINIEAILRESAAVKDIRTQIDKYRTAFQTDIQREEDALRNANQELNRQRAILSPEAFAEERRKFEARLGGVQNMVQQRKQDLDRALNLAMREVHKALNAVVVDLANEHKFTLLLRQEQTVLVAKGLEITDEALALLDKNLPAVKVPDPSTLAPAPAAAPQPGARAPTAPAAPAAGGRGAAPRTGK